MDQNNGNASRDILTSEGRSQRSMKIGKFGEEEQGKERKLGTMA